MADQKVGAIRRACVDIGTNTALLLACSVENGKVSVLDDISRIVRLGQGVDRHREFHPEALARLESALRFYQERCRALGVTESLAVATSATRDVKDASELFELCQSYGFPLTLLSGEKEALYTFLGAGHVSGVSHSAVIDVGGGSTEIIWGHKGRIQKKQSFDVGAVRLTERFVSSHPASDAMVASLRAAAREEFSSVPPGARPDVVVAVAGTPTALASLELAKPFEKSAIDGYTLTLDLIEDWAIKLSAMSLSARAQLPGMPKGREDVLPAGAFVLAEALKSVGASQVLVSTRGLRYGVIDHWQRVRSQ